MHVLKPFACIKCHKIDYVNNQIRKKKITIMKKAVKFLIMGAFVFGLSAPAMAQDYQSVIGEVSKALKEDPQATGTAKQLVKDFMKTYKKNPEAMVALGNAYLTGKNYTKAVECADLALKKNKNYGDAYILKGDVEALKDDGGQAAMWYQQAMNLDPKNPNGYMSYANVYRKRSPQEAENARNQLRQNVPDFPIEAETGHIFYTSGNYEKALEYFNKSNVSKLSESRIGEYALAALQAGDYAKGLSVSKTAVQRFPENTGFLRLAMMNGVFGQQYNDAVQYAEKLMSSSAEKNAGDYNYYGQALAGAEQHEKAIEQFTKAFSMDGEAYKNLQAISEAYSALGNTDKALEYSIQYLDKNPDAKPSEFSKLALIYVEKVKAGEDKDANWQKAMDVYDNLVKKYPHTAIYAKFQKGHQAYRCENDDVALSYLLPLISELEAKSDISDDEKSYLINSLSEVGYIYWGDKNDLESATPYYKKLYELKPDDSTARKALGLDQPQEETTE